MFVRLAQCIGRWCIPPVEQRTPHTALSSFVLLLAVLSHLPAAYIRLHRAHLSYFWRLLYVLVVIPFTLRAFLSHYIHLGSPDTPPSSWSGFDACSAMCVPITISLTLDFLFLGKDHEFVVRDAQEYRRWLDEQNRSSTKESADEQPHSLEQPRHFPGTIMRLYVDMALSARAFGYVRGVDQRHGRYRAGYHALMASEKLAQRPKREAQQIKRAAIARTIRIILVSFLIYDAVQVVFRHPNLLAMPIHDPFSVIRDSFIGLPEALQYSKLGRLSLWIGGYPVRQCVIRSLTRCT